MHADRFPSLSPHIHTHTPHSTTSPNPQGWFREQLEKAKGRVASGVVVGEYSLDFKSYPSLTGQLTGEQLWGLQQLLLAEQRQFGVIGPNPSVRGMDADTLDHAKAYVCAAACLPVCLSACLPACNKHGHVFAPSH